jgi:hypothetical protein
MTDLASPDLRDLAVAAAGAMLLDDVEVLSSVSLSDAYEDDHPDVDPFDMDDEEMLRYLRDVWIPENVDGALKTLRSAAEDQEGTLRVWRSVVLDGDPVTVLRSYMAEKGVGVFWSHDRDQAHPHEAARLDGETYLIEGLVDAGSVDWVATLATYAHPDWVGEDEIRVMPDGMVELVSLMKRGGWLSRNADDLEEVVGIGDLAGRSIAAGAPTPELAVSSPAMAFG